MCAYTLHVNCYWTTVYDAWLFIEKHDFLLYLYCTEYTAYTTCYVIICSKLAGMYLGEYSIRVVLSPGVTRVISRYYIHVNAMYVTVWDLLDPSDEPVCGKFKT